MWEFADHPTVFDSSNKVRPLHKCFLLFEKIEWSADVDNVYLAKNDHRWVAFIVLKTINSDLQQGPRERLN